MPFLPHRNTLSSNNARASDVAAKLTESIVPLQQAKMQAAFRVQGQPGVLYNRLTSGVPCSCVSANEQVSILSPDGKASNGIINRVLTGNSNFGVAAYDPTLSRGLNAESYLNPASGIEDWGADFNGGELSGFIDMTKAPSQTNQDMALPGFDLDTEFGHFGLTDVACPICFGSGYVGGFQPLKGFRKVIAAHQMQTSSTLELPQFELAPGEHSFQVTFPLGLCRVEAYRAFCGRELVPFTSMIDGNLLDRSGGRASIMPYCDGTPHTITVITESPITHFEIQGTVANNTVYFEMPKRSKSADLAQLERGEPFQVLVSPEVPHIDTLDVIVEASQGKVLVVQGVTPWKTKAQQGLGFELQVRVAQPQELWYILPRPRVTSQKTATPNTKSQQRTNSGFKD